MSLATLGDFSSTRILLDPYGLSVASLSWFWIWLLWASPILEKTANN